MSSPSSQYLRCFDLRNVMAPTDRKHPICGGLPPLARYLFGIQVWCRIGISKCMYKQSKHVWVLVFCSTLSLFSPIFSSEDQLVCSNKKPARKKSPVWKANSLLSNANGTTHIHHISTSFITSLLLGRSMFFFMIIYKGSHLTCELYLALESSNRPSVKGYSYYHYSTGNQESKEKALLSCLYITNYLVSIVLLVLYEFLCILIKRV